MSGSPRPPRVPAGQAGLGTFILSALIHHSEKLRSRTSDGRRSSEGGGGVQGRRAPASRTRSRGHTRTHRDTCPQGSPSQTQRWGSYWGPAPRAPLLGRHSIQPHGEGCERRHSREARGAPISGGAGGPADTPAPGHQPRARPARGPLGGRQSGLLGGPLSAQPHGPKCG